VTCGDQRVGPRTIRLFQFVPGGSIAVILGVVIKWSVT